MKSNLDYDKNVKMGEYLKQEISMQKKVDDQ